MKSENELIKKNIVIGRNMKKARQASGLSQSAVAVKLQLSGIDIHRKTISEMEVGTCNINALVLVALANLYGTAIQDFFAGLEAGHKIAAMPNRLKQDLPIGVNLRKYRKAAGLSQEKAAAELQLMGLDMSREILSQIEIGIYSVRISVLLALADLYCTPIQDFFAGLEQFDGTGEIEE